MTTDDFRSLAQTRAAEAQALIGVGHWAGAYYLAGYAVECALKAVIASQTQAGEFPDLDRARSSYTHRLPDLMRVARLEHTFGLSLAQSPALRTNWETVRRWRETARYDPHTSERNARLLVEAVDSEPHGLLQWLRNHW